MLMTRKPFLEMTAADVMSSSLVTIPEGMSLRSAARLLSDEDISGAPVVDDEGRCTGILSATDFLRWAGNGTRAAVTFDPGASCITEWAVVDVEVLPLDEVRSYMTTDVVTATPADSLRKLARMMLDAHIHRVVIVDKQKRPIGIVSSTDLIAAVANAPAEE
jgi:CBS-domain-containing membrane protein